MVRLEGVTEILTQPKQLRFNSNMVRLKDIFFTLNVYTDMFQFQYGTIKRRLKKSCPKLLTGFNSNIVRLKESLWFVSYLWVSCFNSNMVRLKDLSRFCLLWQF